jgi:predicted dehydrogenase
MVESMAQARWHTLCCTFRMDSPAPRHSDGTTKFRAKKEATRSYDELDELLGGDLDAISIALPNDQHREFAVRAARAGVHVLCEKPMGLTAWGCQVMIQATQSAGVKLMIAYRPHFERAMMASACKVRLLWHPRASQRSITAGDESRGMVCE